MAIQKDEQHTSAFTDRQARCLIIAAEAIGYEREPELFARQYDADLHEDAAAAAGFLLARGRRLSPVLEEKDPVPTWAAVDRLLDEGRMSGADLDAVVAAAEERGFQGEEPDAVTALLSEWSQAHGHVAFLWEHHFDVLEPILGDQAQLAPLPDGALDRIDYISHRYAGELPDKKPEGFDAVMF